MSLGETLVAESLGMALMSFGGKLSLSPPLGGSILAQEVSKKTWYKTSDTQIEYLNNSFMLR